MLKLLQISCLLTITMHINCFKLSLPDTNVTSLGGLRNTIHENIHEEIESILFAEKMFHADITELTNLPIVTVASIINKVCSVALKTEIEKPMFTPDTAKIKFILMKSDTEKYPYPLEDSHKLWNTTQFNFNLPTVILISGWTTDLEYGWDYNMITSIAKAYFCRGGFNVIAIDPAKYIRTLYTWSSYNTAIIGKLVAQSLATLLKDYNYPSKKIHIVGHSLGAQIAGSIGKYYNEITDDLLGRITGLDPANPCFNVGGTLTGLDRGDAEFVDVIHTNNGMLGKREPLGDIDFYPNGILGLPPGCFEIICAHSRSFQFYAESVYPGNEMGFMGVKCTSLDKLNKKNCKGTPYPMGYATPKFLKGNFFLNTNSKSPFGMFSRDNPVCDG